MSSISGDVNVINTLLFGGPSPAMREQIHQEHQAFVQNAPPTLSARIIERTHQMYQAFNGSAAMQMVSNALSNVKAAVAPDIIYTFRTTEQLQSAQPTMQSYIMANRVVRQAYHRHEVDGYSDTYTDLAPGVIGQGHQPYEHVMDGVIEMNEDGTGSYTNFVNARNEDGVPLLSVYEKAAVLNTWKLLERAFEEGDRDPTSPWNDPLN